MTAAIRGDLPQRRIICRRNSNYFCGRCRVVGSAAFVFDLSALTERSIYCIIVYVGFLEGYMPDFYNSATIYVSQAGGCDDASGLRRDETGDYQGPLKTVEAAL